MKDKSWIVQLRRECWVLLGEMSLLTVQRSPSSEIASIGSESVTISFVLASKAQPSLIISDSLSRDGSSFRGIVKSDNLKVLIASISGILIFV